MNQPTGLHYNTACTDYPRCWGVGLLLIRSCVLGNEAHENRNDRLLLKVIKEIVDLFLKNK